MSTKHTPHEREGILYNTQNRTNANTHGWPSQGVYGGVYVVWYGMIVRYGIVRYGMVWYVPFGQRLQQSTRESV